MKPLGGFTGYNSEWRELAEVVSRVNEKESSISFTFCLLFFFYKNFLFHLLSHISSHFSRTLRHYDIFLITFHPPPRIIWLQARNKKKMKKIIRRRTNEAKNGKVIQRYTHARAPDQMERETPLRIKKEKKS